MRAETTGPRTPHVTIFIPDVPTTGDLARLLWAAGTTKVSAE